MQNIPDKLTKPYKPKDVEDRIYALWEEGGFFNPDICAEKGVTDPDMSPFSVILPPPNVTGTLHMGHAFEDTLQDITVRFARMQGRKTLWVPGTDHAAIATASKVEAKLYKKERKTRHDLGRDAFLERVERFAAESHDIIVNQIKKMGASLDWSREAFTLDEKRSRAVRTAFKRMYDAGLIYRGARIVNWDPKMQSNVSDDEVEWEEETTKFYYLKYGPFTIGTARPETKFGDKYVVMHPADKRHANYAHGQTIELEWINGPITATIVKDEAVDMEFGTGVMTITPWHDATDFDIAERHGLSKEQIIGYDGKLLSIAGEFAGMHITKARPLIVKKMQGKGLVEKIDENYTHRIAKNYRGGGLIEPQVRKQWFINVAKPFVLKDSKLKGLPSGKETNLKEIMQKTVSGGQIKIIPEHFKKIYFHWINNLRDWCISRQIWYGHRIPVWYCEKQDSDSCKKPVVSIEELHSCPYCGGEAKQDPDTLDTWFSSGLWTFSTLGWPEETNELALYHPTSVMAPGYEILFFWVARMILMSGFLLEDIPFKTVVLHGIVRDKHGQKFSKSRGNGVDPLDMTEKYGADALRMGVIVGASPGNDVKFDEEKVRGYKHFANKLWNITRFVVANVADYDGKVPPKIAPADEKYIQEFSEIVENTTKNLAAYQLHLAAETLYHYAWHMFADKLIEESKPVLAEGSEAEKLSRQYTLLAIWRDTIKMLHPFMPFVTEEIWSLLPHPRGAGRAAPLLLVERWPSAK